MSCLGYELKVTYEGVILIFLKTQTCDKWVIKNAQIIAINLKHILLSLLIWLWYNNDPFAKYTYYRFFIMKKVNENEFNSI